MMIGAKEGSRTPTRVTPLEPEGTEPSDIRLTVREVSDVLWSNMRPQNAAANRTVPGFSGACTGIGIGDFRSAPTLVFWHREPAAWREVAS